MVTKYLFADESGNFDFRCHLTLKGPTRYFAVGTLMMDDEVKVKALRTDLLVLRDDLNRNGTAHHGPFHCTEDTPKVRSAVFEVLKGHDFKVDVTVLEKAKAQPQTRVTDATFYRYAWFYHLKHFANHYFKANDELMGVSAGLGTKRTKKVFREAVEDVVAQCCSCQVNQRFGHWNADSDPALQATDYALWAVMRDVERGEKRFRSIIDDKIESVYDLWARGSTFYYGQRAVQQVSA